MRRQVLLTLACLALAAPAPAAPVRQDEIVKNYGFRVEIDGVDAGFFKSVEGLSIEQEVIEFQSGGETLVHKLPGRVKYPNIVLKQGFVPGSTLNDWIEASATGNTVRKNISITLVDRARNNQELHRWNLLDCFPASWKLGALEARPTDPLTEELTVACDSFVEP